MSLNWTKQVQMYPNSLRLRNRYAINTFICKNLENQLYSWDFLSLELTFSLLWKPMIACPPKHPHLGFAHLGKRLLTALRIGSTLHVYMVSKKIFCPNFTFKWFWTFQKGKMAMDIQCNMLHSYTWWLRFLSWLQVKAPLHLNFISASTFNSYESLSSTVV